MKLFPLLLAASACGHISNDPPPQLPGPRDQQDVVADAQVPLPHPPPRVEGAWTWGTGGQPESWTLEVTEGVVSGSYERSVVRDACTIVWRYSVRGAQDGTGLTLAETDVEALPGDCAPDAPVQELDSARGVIYGDVIVLQWRGGKRQVLRRPNPRPADAE